MDSQTKMYAYLHLLRGYKKPLLYKIPPHLSPHISRGDIVTVPFQKRHEQGIVSETLHTLPESCSFAIREIEQKEMFPDDPRYLSFVESIAAHYCISPLHLFERLYSVLHAQTKNKIHKKEITLPEENSRDSVTLTHAQEKVVSFITPYIHASQQSTTLLHGVTGSGKSEVYAALIRTALQNQKSVFLLLPDVSLALQFQNIFSAKLSSAFPVLGFHSASSPQEKKSVWDAMCNATPALIIGVHLPILLPCSNLGLIIIDEEHDPNFQEKKNPRLCSKHVALMRAKQYSIPILLGSATPALSSLYQVKQKKWKFFQLTERFSGTFPSIKIVPLTKPDYKRSFWISKDLEREIKDRLEKKEQILIYINRRGYSFFVMCKECGFVFSCSSCSVSLTVHAQGESISLHCHYCSALHSFPKECSSCHAPEKSLLKKGIGTQHVVSLLSALFPNARIARADLETTRRRKSWKETMHNFEQGNIDILVGTQTITKGYHFPRVTLVGIIWGDLNLHFPSYDATERTLQQLIQVAGRAGRASSASTVIVQVINDHPVFAFLEEQKYLSFYKDEIEYRRQWSYPPFSSMVTIELSHTKAVVVHEEARLLSAHLTALHSQNPSCKILGPVKPPVHRIQKKEYRHLIIKSISLELLQNLMREASNQPYKSSVAFMYAQ